MRLDYEFALIRLLSHVWTARHHTDKSRKASDEILDLALKNLILNVGEDEYDRLLAEEGVFRNVKIPPNKG